MSSQGPRDHSCSYVFVLHGFARLEKWIELTPGGGGGARTAAEAASEGVHTACVRDREADPMRGTAPTLLPRLARYKMY